MQASQASQPSQSFQLEAMLAQYTDLNKLTCLRVNFNKIQDPTKISKPELIQQDLNQTRAILNKTIDSLLTRGEKLDDLVDKSAHLSIQAKEFYKQSKGNNCCFAT